MSRIAVCSKYFGYAVGGAEHSTLRMLMGLEAEGHQIIVLRNAGPRHFGAMERPQELPASWELRDYRLPVDFLRFRFVEYLLNRRHLQRLGADLADADVLYSYGFEAPAILQGFDGERVYVVRDEYGLGWMRNYAAGLKGRLAYGLYIALEALPRRLWRRDLARLLRAPRSRAMANSRFMARALRQGFGTREVEVVLPEIDHAALVADHAAAQGSVAHRGVVFVGDGRLKGVDVALQIARAMPDTPFHIFARKALDDLPANVTRHAWARPGAVYAHADAVIVPSRWDEAYGRVVAEATGLGVPVIISDREGLKEAAAGRATVIDTLDDIPAWVAALRRVLPEQEPSHASRL